MTFRRMSAAVAFVITVTVSAFATATAAHAEPDISCATGNPTGLDTASRGFVRLYPQVCIDKTLAAAHAEGFTAPGGDAELISLGKIACRQLDVDESDMGRAAERAVRGAEPKLVASAPDPGYAHDTIYDDFVQNIVVKSLCP